MQSHFIDMVDQNGAAKRPVVDSTTGAQRILSVGGIADVLTGGASVTTPAAGSSMATITAPAAGVYRVRLIWIISGTAETQAVNFRLRNGTNPLATLLPSLPGTYTLEVDRVTLDGSGSLNTCAIALATTGAIYTSSIIATRLF